MGRFPLRLHASQLRCGQIFKKMPHATPIARDHSGPSAPLVIAAYFAGTLLIGAALAPWLFHAAKSFAAWSAQQGWDQLPVIGSWQESIARSDFTRVFNRAVLIGALACFWPAARALRLRRGELSLEKNRRWARDLVAGFLIAAGLLLAMGAIYYQTGLFIENKKASLGSALQNALTRAAGVGLIEELFFRGALLGLVLRAWPAKSSLLFVTTVFAAVHFLQAPPKLVIHENVQPGTGFWLVGEILRTFTDTDMLLAQFATLWFAGWILGAARLRTRSLWLPIGLHTGWVFGIGLYASLAKASRAVRKEEYLPWIGNTLINGLVPLAALAVTSAAVWAYLRWLRRASGQAIQAAGNAPAAD